MVDDDTVVTPEEALAKTQPPTDPANPTSVVSISFSVNAQMAPVAVGTTSRGPLPQMVATPTTTTTQPTPS